MNNYNLDQIKIRVLTFFSKHSTRIHNPIDRYHVEARILCHVFAVSLEISITILLNLLSLVGL